MKVFSRFVALPRLGQRGFKLFGFASVLGMGAALFAAPTLAAERIVFTFGPLGRSIPVADLQTLAETGKATRQIRWYLNVADLEAETLQQILTKEVGVSLRLIDRAGYSLPGEYVLYQIGNTVHTKSRRANIQALRSALILSVSDDNRLSLLEFFQNYPTQELYVDGRSLLTFVNDVEGIIDRIEPVVAAVQTVLEGLVCDCEPSQTAQP
jgi:hypothetical protein